MTTVPEASKQSPDDVPVRPCRYCVADAEGHVIRTSKGNPDPELLKAVRPSAQECEWNHDHNSPAVYALARALAVVFQDRSPSDEQIGWLLPDANDVVADFDPAPDTWRVRRLPDGVNDGERGIEVRLRINGVTYVGLEGGKDTRGNLVRLSTFRAQEHGISLPGHVAVALRLEVDQPGGVS